MDIRVEVTGRLTELLVSVRIQVSKEIQESFIGILGKYNIVPREEKKHPNIKKKIEHFLAVK